MPELSPADRTVRAEQAFLVTLLLTRSHADGDPFQEIRELTSAAGARVVGVASQRRDRPVPGTFFGKGKIREIAELAETAEADLVIVDADLSPAQVRNLESELRLKVIDRTELILDIFASRARTLQARLQVELAQLEYTLPRLKRMWTHLSRIEGGIGMRGPGEKQIESDRRAANRRIRDLKRNLAEIQARRHRTVESRNEHFTVSLVGYTNAGKSTLMNLLTDSGISVRDRLFETLDTRTRAWDLSGGKRVLLSDTIGFIRKLPHHLVASFHATLEETLRARLLLHVVDASALGAEEQMAAVEKVLREIGAGDNPVLVVFNKIDLPHNPIEIERLKSGHPHHVTVSALTGEGIDRLEAGIVPFIESEMVQIELELSTNSGAVEAAVARSGKLLSVEYGSRGTRLKALVPRDLVPSIRKMAKG